MKKWVNWFCIAVLMVTVCACGAKKDNSAAGTQEESGNIEASNDSSEESYYVVEEPGTLDVVCEGEAHSADLGTYSWDYMIEDGVYEGIEADSDHVLEQAEKLPVITLGDSRELTLDFALGMPDEIRVRCWSSDFWGDEGSFESNFEELEVTDGVITAPEGGKYAYEVYARWDEVQGYGGSAWYGFVTEG